MLILVQPATCQWACCQRCGKQCTINGQFDPVCFDHCILEHCGDCDKPGIFFFLFYSLD